MEEKESCFLIEGVSKDDWIGFDSYLDSLESAITNNAKFIGLIADYGSGKSTLVEMLKYRFELKNTKLIKINMWNCNNTDDEKEIDIHRSFLHQLIDCLEISNSKYYKKKIDKNYNVFDIRFKSDFPWIAIFLLLFFLLAIVQKLGFYDFYKDKFLSYLLFAILSVIAVILYKPIIAYKKADNTSRIIDENDVKDLYNEIVEEYFSYNEDSKIIICLEELDRYDNPKIILKYLKEFYKYYKENSDDKDIVFIVSLKSPYQLNKFDSEKLLAKNDNMLLKKEAANASAITETKNNADDMSSVKNNGTPNKHDYSLLERDVKKIKDIYEKVFDFILNLNQINIHDFDSIINSIIEAKKDYLPDGIKVPSKNNVKRWRYLYKGENITIRDIKHRYNFAISLFLSVKESGLNPSFDKCLFISYLEDEYNDLYESLKVSNTINSILVDYSNGVRKFSKYILYDSDSDEHKALLEGLDSKYISVDYNYYFFKFPKNKKPYNLYELELYNAIFYDEDSKKLSLSLKKLDNQKIENILSKRANPDFVPRVVFNYPKLISAAIKKDYNACVKSLCNYYNIIDDYDTFSLVYSNLKKNNKYDFTKIIDDYFVYYLKEIRKLDVDVVNKLRPKIAKILGPNSMFLKNLFFSNYSLISEEEIKYINNFDVILNLTNFDVLDEQFIKNIANYINTSKVSKKSILELIGILSKNENLNNNLYKLFIDSIDFENNKFREDEIVKIYELSKNKMDLSNFDNFYCFVNHINFYCKRLDNIFLQIMKDTDLESNIDKYRKILNKYGIIYIDGMNLFDKHKRYPFSKKIRDLFFENGFYEYYVVSTKLDEDIFEIEDDKFDVLSSFYIYEFENKTPWKHSVGPKMKEFLFNSKIDWNKLDDNKLSIFSDMNQNIGIIKAVINTNNDQFINNYISKIKSIKKSDINDVFRIVGQYNKTKRLNKKAKRNLKSFTKNADLINLLDARKKVNV